jgi:hypothetical protein
MPESIIGIRPIKDWVLVDIYDDGERLTRFAGGKKFWLPSDDKFDHHAIKRGTDHKHSGIRPRWAMVVAVGEHAEQRGIAVGQKVLCDEMKWTRGFQNTVTNARAWAIKTEDILLVDEDGFDEDDLEKLAPRYPRMFDAKEG